MPGSPRPPRSSRAWSIRRAMRVARPRTSDGWRASGRSARSGAFAIDRVRMIGDRVAAIAAESRAAADEAARLVEVEYDELPLVTLENALDPDAAILHPDPDAYT